VCGPTGSGKTTTLYSIMNVLNQPKVNIVTIEDPVEYDMRYVNQMQVNRAAGLTFANGLRSILRQDPDIIMVGEVRDKDTAAISVQSALTGHMVFSTLHTNDAPSAITRLQEMDVESYLLSSCLLAVMAQRLVRKICRHCKEEAPVSEGFIEEASRAL
jgi:type II secretory ATPase GspE/PulE/Tfp pilus assembly ATPase PilB-like protein